jgi:hypothetical protein
MIPALLSDLGEGVLIANQSSLEKLYQKFPDDFRSAWAWISVPSFFPGIARSIRIGVLYFSAQHDVGPLNLKGDHHLSPENPDHLSCMLDELRRKEFSMPCIVHHWEPTSVLRLYSACGDEMNRRRDPSASECNVTLDDEGRIRTWISLYQEKADSTPGHLMEFLRQINRKHPLELTLQRGSRMALSEVIQSGAWTISQEAHAAIQHAVESFDRDRAPLSPILDVQRIGWIDDAEELTCKAPFLHFLPGKKYKISTQTIEWKKNQNRPRYHAGKRDVESVLVRGTDLRITLHHSSASPTHFLFNPEAAGTLHTTYSLEDLAAHFDLPEVKDITTIYPEEYAANLSLLDELEQMTP